MPASEPPPKVFYSPYCRCGERARPADGFALEWCDVDIHWDEAAALGIVRLPAVVRDGKILAQGAAALQWLATGPGGVR